MTVETASWGIARTVAGGGARGRYGPAAPPREAGSGEPEPRYFRWSHAPSGIHLARLLVNSSGHTVTGTPFCHCSM
jgi:hypothetical protein